MSTCFLSVLWLGAELILQVSFIPFSQNIDSVQCTHYIYILVFYFPHVDLLQYCQHSVKSLIYNLCDNTFKSLLKIASVKMKLWEHTGIKPNPGYHLHIYNTTAYFLLIFKGKTMMAFWYFSKLDIHCLVKLTLQMSIYFNTAPLLWCLVHEEPVSGQRHLLSALMSVCRPLWD